MALPVLEPVTLPTDAGPIDGFDAWSGDDLAALLAAARALFRSAALAGRLDDPDDPLRITVDGPHLWRLGEALDRPYRRREAADPALAGAAPDDARAFLAW